MESYYLYHRSPELSDIEICYIVNHQQQSSQSRAAKRRRQEAGPVTRYPAHRLCLSGNSGVMRTEIESGATEIVIALEDEADIPAADAMIAVMYGVPNALQATDHQSVLRMALLANKYDAPKVLSTAVQHLEQQQELDADAMELFWKLPGCWEQPFWPLVPQAVQYKLASTGTLPEKLQAITELLLYVCDRDLEAVWADSSSTRRDLLMGLPIEVLTDFLQSSELRVISEDTVLYTVVKRTELLMQARPRLSTADLEQQRTQLMSAVRMPHLSGAGLSYIAPHLPWLSNQDCLKAAFVGRMHLRVTGQNTELPASRLGDPAHWLLPPRGVSPRSHIFEFSTSLVDVQGVLSNTLAKSVESSPWATICLASSGSSTFAGRQWECKLQIERKVEGVTLGVYVGPMFPMLSEARVREMPWMTRGMNITIGQVSRRMSHTVDRGKKGYSNLFGVMSSSEDWEAPTWAQDGRVVVRVTVFAGNVIV